MCQIKDECSQCAEEAIVKQCRSSYERGEFEVAICMECSYEIPWADYVLPDVLAALEVAIRVLKVHNIDEAMACEFEILTYAVEKAKREPVGPTVWEE